MTTETAKKLGEIYGPYAFGVVSLLVIWFTIVSPQLDRQAVNHQESAVAVQAMREVTNNMQRVAESVERTALLLESAIKRTAQ